MELNLFLTKKSVTLFAGLACVLMLISMVLPIQAEIVYDFAEDFCSSYSSLNRKVLKAISSNQIEANYIFS